MTRDLYAEVTERILEALEQGTVPWRQNWVKTGLPVNIITRKPYRGSNILALHLQGFGDPRWGTFKAMQDAAIAKGKAEGRDLVIEESKRGRRVFEIVDGQKVWYPTGAKKGEKSTTGVFWKIVKRQATPEDDDPGSYKILRYHALFNAQQCENVPALIEEPREFTPIEEAQQIVDNYVSPGPGPVAVHGFSHCAYNVGRDIVEMPDPSMFFADSGYYHTLFHELVHSTGHEKRLGRIEPALFGSDPYAREELVAEMGAAFLAAMCGLDDEQQAEASYIAGWLKKIGDDQRLVVTAGAAAQRAVDMICDTQFAPEPEEAEKVAVPA